MSNFEQIKELSLKELKELQAKIEAEIPTKAKKAARDAATEVRRIMNAFNVSWDVLVEELNKPKATKKTATRKKRTKKVTAKVAPKYQHPDNAELTWAGRGRKPKWLEAELAQGKSVDDFKI